MCERGQIILLGYYPLMREHRERRAKAGLPTWGIGIDRCLAGQIISLWKAGIRTTACCCGHGKYDGKISVVYEDFAKVIELGWKKYNWEDEPDRKDTVFAKKPYPCDDDIELNGQLTGEK